LKSQELILLFIALSLSSCIKEYIPENNNITDQRLVAVAEIEAGELTTINLSSTFSSTFPEIDIDHELSFVKIINYESGNAIPEEYRYDYDKEAYSDDFIPKEGQLYDLNIDITLTHPEVPIIFATTRVPYASDIKNSEILNRHAVVDQLGNEFQQFEVSLQVEPLKNENTFFHLIPYIRIPDDPNNETEALEIVNILAQENASFLLSHIDGMLIDQTKLTNDNILTLDLRTNSPFDMEEIENSFIYFELRTVTDDYYNFHVSLSRQKDSNSGPFTLPVTTYTNINNGYGLFAAFSTHLDSVLIK